MTGRARYTRHRHRRSCDSFATIDHRSSVAKATSTNWWQTTEPDEAPTNARTDGLFSRRYRPTRLRNGLLRRPQHQRVSRAPHNCRIRSVTTRSRFEASSSRLTPSQDYCVAEWIGCGHGVAVVGTLFLVLELSFERVSVLRYRPDVLWKLSPCLHADEAARHALLQERLRDIPRMNVYSVAKSLVIAWLDRRRKVEVTGISLMQRTPAVPHSSCETGEYRWIRALPYSPFHVESRSWLYWSSRHWPSAIRMPRMVVTSAQSVESREIPVQSTGIGRKLNPRGLPGRHLPARRRRGTRVPGTVPRRVVGRAVPATRTTAQLHRPQQRPGTGVAAGAGRRSAAHRRTLRAARPATQHRHHRSGRHHRGISQAGGVRSLPGRAWLPADDRTVGGSRSDRRRPAPRRQRARQAGTAELLPRAIKLNPFTSFLYWRMNWHA